MSLAPKALAEAGAAGAAAAVPNAINDALQPLGTRLLQIPATPERILRALGKLDAPGHPNTGED